MYRNGFLFGPMGTTKSIRIRCTRRRGGGEIRLRIGGYNGIVIGGLQQGIATEGSYVSGLGWIFNINDLNFGPAETAKSISRRYAKGSEGGHIKFRQGTISGELIGQFIPPLQKFDTFYRVLLATIDLTNHLYDLQCHILILHWYSHQ